ncbi:MAG TPA: hypothetical protein VIY66_13930 [Candidatus Acidoferrales bacterium]
MALAVLAAVIAMPPINRRVEERAWLQWLCISVIFLFAAGEIVVIHHTDKIGNLDRQKQTQQYLDEMKVLTQISSGLGSVNDSLANLRTEPRPITPSTSFKVEALHLVKDIYGFAASAQATEPSLGTLPPSEGEIAFDRWSRDTISSYMRTFDPRLIETTRNLKAKGIDTSRIEGMCVQPVNTLTIIECARELQGLVDGIH